MNRLRAGSWSIVLPVLLAGACYLPGLRGPLISDDHALLAANPALRQAGNPARFLDPTYWRQTHPGTKGLYRPLRETVFALLHACAGPSPLAHHILSVSLHAAAAGMVFLLGRAVFGGVRPALLAALLFAAHPVNAEAVLWAKNAGDLLCGLFAVATAWLVLRPAAGTGRLVGPALAALAFALSLLSKESSIALPLLLAVHLAGRPGSGARQALRRTAGLWVVAAAYAAVIVAPLFAGDAPVLGAPRTIRVSAPLRLAMTAKTAAFYHRLLLVPAPLNAMHQFNHPTSLADAETARDMALGIGVVALTLFAAVRLPRARLALLWPLVMLVPALNILPYSGRPVGENRLYLPSVGLCLLGGLALHALAGRRRGWAGTGAVAALAAVLLAVFCAGVADRAWAWSSNRGFWVDVGRKSPGWPEAFHSLGRIYQGAGLPGLALPLFERAVRQRDAGTPPETFADYRMSLGAAYAGSGRTAEARREFAAALRLAPGRVEARFLLAELGGDPAELRQARADLEAALTQRPGWAEGWFLLGRCHAVLGETPEAARAFGRAVEIEPSSVPGRVQHGQVCLSLGRLAEAAESFAAACRLAPGSGPLWERLAAALLGLGRFAEAEDAFRRSLDLSPAYPPALAGLGVTLLEQGRPAEAVDALAQAARLAPGEVRSHAALGAALAALGRWESAIQPLETAARLASASEPRAQRVWRQLVECYRRVDRPDRALAWQRKVAEANPSDEEAQALMRELRQAVGSP